jgi:hypothetical protein
MTLTTSTLRRAGCSSARRARRWPMGCALGRSWPLTTWSCSCQG